MANYLILFLVLFASAAQYQDSKKHFRFEYDENQWRIPAPKREEANPKDVDRAFAERTLLNLQRKEADDKYHASFSVVVDKPKKIRGLDNPLLAYKEHAIGFLKKQRFGNFETKALQLKKLNIPAFEIVASQRDFGLTFRQVVFIYNEEAYLLTLAARSSKFKDYESQTQRFFDTFQFN